MEDKLKLEIVTPYGSIFSDDVDEISAAGSEGEFGVFPQHAPFITMLKTGMLTCKKGSENLIFFVSGGYAEVGPDRVVILGDSAERSEDIDVERAKAAMKRAEERLKKIDEIDFVRATAALERSTIRVQIAEKHTLK
jgi:F-type H+-transporting ATPase subunit epsilon